MPVISVLSIVSAAYISSLSNLLACFLRHVPALKALVRELKLQMIATSMSQERTAVLRAVARADLGGAGAWY